ncbi:hypothetical protein ASG89_16295 [Paenibacillus sp. Soil766]|nr:hypothetical protein ASG89_16295 [Paenibacillus sp. Soil766]
MVLLTWTHLYISLFDMNTLILSFDRVADAKKGNAGFLSNLYGNEQEEGWGGARRGKGILTPFSGVNVIPAQACSRNKAHFGP